MMQVENESGLLSSVRDYSPEATRLFNGPVPAQFVTALKKKPGTWTEVFGPRMAEEAFTVYYPSTYIDTAAKAGKAVYPLLTYCNVWMGGDNTNDNFDITCSMRWATTMPLDSRPTEWIRARRRASVRDSPPWRQTSA
jgi:hypothetical protein